MQKSKRNESRIRMIKMQLSLLLLAIGCFVSACGKVKDQKESGISLKPEAAEVHGDSVNMRGGGLAEGDENGIFYVWDGKLIYQKTGQEAEVLDENGAEYLCLTPQTLYYVSRNEAGERGIYARNKGDFSERELVLAADARYLYEYDGFLYYITYPQGADVCRVNLKDGSVQTLAEGNFDSLLVTKDALFYRDMTTKQYLRSSFDADGEPGQAEEWLAFTEDRMPFLDGEWIYYDLGDFLYHYKVSLNDKTSMGRHARTTDDMLILDGQKYENNTKTDLNTGEQSTFSEELYTRLIGFAGKRLIYEAYDYTEETLLTEHPPAERTVLYSYDLESGETLPLAGTQKPAQLSAEKAAAYYDRLQQGELTLLKENEVSFAAHFMSAEEWTHYDLDLDGDNIPERFLFMDMDSSEAGSKERSGKKSMILHADWDGVSLYQTDFSDGKEWYEPLEDGTILYQYEFVLGGYGNRFYEIYRFEPGGKRVLVDSYQHVTAQLDEIAYDADIDTLIKKDRYYAGEEFTKEADWIEQVEAVLQKRVWKNELK